MPRSCADVAELIRLISASVQSVVFYGFNCQTTEMRLYTTLCMLTGLAGSIIPFQAWFNERRNKVRFPSFPTLSSTGDWSSQADVTQMVEMAHRVLPRAVLRLAPPPHTSEYC